VLCYRPNRTPRALGGGDFFVRLVVRGMLRSGATLGGWRSRGVDVQDDHIPTICSIPREGKDPCTPGPPAIVAQHKRLRSGLIAIVRLIRALTIALVSAAREERACASATRGSPGRATVAIVRRRLRGVAFDGASFVMFSFAPSAAIALPVASFMFGIVVGHPVMVGWDPTWLLRQSAGKPCGSTCDCARTDATVLTAVRERDQLAKAKRSGSRRRPTRLISRAGYAREQARSSPPSRVFFSRAGTAASASPVSDCRSISGSRYGVHASDEIASDSLASVLDAA
jgi:hypothetical protein